MSILVTGGAGFIGSALIKKLAEASSMKVLGIDISQEMGGYVEKCSTLDIVKLREIFDKHKVKSVIHLGMTSSEREALRNRPRARKSILQGTESLVKVFNEYKGDRFVFVSSSMVYGHFRTDTIDEYHPTNPIEYYGRLKLEAEKIVRKGVSSFTIIRPIAVYGVNDKKRRVVSALYEKAARGETLILENPQAKLDFTYVDDVVSGITQAMECAKAHNQIFNLSYGKAYSLLELFHYIQEFYPNIVFKESSKRLVKKARRGSLCSEKLKELCLFEPRVSLREGLKLLHEHRSN